MNSSHLPSGSEPSSEHEEDGRPLDPERVAHDLQLHCLELQAEITSLREARAAAESAWTRVTEAYELAPIACFRLGKDTRISEPNRAAVALFALERDELARKTLLSLIDAEDRAALRSIVRLCQEQHARSSGDVRLELPGAGSAVYRVIATPLRATDGRSEGCKVALVDITVDKRAEQRLQILATATAKLADVGPGGPFAAFVGSLVPALGDLCVLDEAGPGGTVARAAVASIEGAWATGAEALRRQLPPPLDAVARRGHGLEAREELARLGGAGSDIGPIVKLLEPASVMVLPLVSGQETLGRIVLARSDPARPFLPADLELARQLAVVAALAMERHRRHRAEQEAQQTRRELTTIASRELKNLVTTIGLSANVLDQEAAHGAIPAPKHLERIKRAVEHLGRALHDLDDTARLASRRPWLTPEPTPVAAIIDESVELLLPLAALKRLELRSGQISSVEARCDRRRVLQVLWNLADNAIKFTPEGGTVTLHAARVENEPVVRFSVIDTGPGISKQVMRRLFARDAPPASTEPEGLGLRISRSIVESHGGALWAETDKGGGAAVHFTLPAAR